jgi:hypothetical protein
MKPLYQTSDHAEYDGQEVFRLSLPRRLRERVYGDGWRELRERQQ